MHEQDSGEQDKRPAKRGKRKTGKGMLSDAIPGQGVQFLAGSPMTQSGQDTCRAPSARGRVGFRVSGTAFVRFVVDGSVYGEPLAVPEDVPVRIDQ
jgi:hypothetical protein